MKVREVLIKLNPQRSNLWYVLFNAPYAYCRWHNPFFILKILFHVLNYGDMAELNWVLIKLKPFLVRALLHISDKAKAMVSKFEL